MSLIHQHEVAKVTIVGPGLFLAPGVLCSHAEDRKSLGLVVAVETRSEAGTVTVLWSRPPVGTIDMMEVKVQEITATSRKLKTEWRSTSVDDLKQNPTLRTLIEFKPA